MIEEQDLRILKALTTNQRLALDFVNQHDPALFLGSARPVAQAICDYIKHYKNIPTLRVLSDKYKDLAGDFHALYQALPSVEFDTKEYQYDLEKFKQKYVDTKFANLKGEIVDKASFEQIEKTLKEIKKVKQPAKSVFTQKCIDEYLPEFQQEYVARLEDPTLTQGAFTGYSFLDHVTNGLSPAELLVIGAESGAGKSLMLNNIALNMWMQKNNPATDPSSYTKGFNVLYFSLEMPYKSCFRRTLARVADVPIYSLRDSRLTKSEVESLNMASRFIRKYSSQAKFEIVDIPRGVTVDQIEERFLEACTRFTPDVVVVDYLGLLDDQDAEGDDWLKLGFIAGKLHEFARAYNTRVMTAVQLNRAQKGAKDTGDNIGLHRIGRSALVCTHANVVVQIETRPNENTRDTFLYHVIKNREGELGKHEVRKKFANAAIFDLPYVPPDRDEFGGFISGFDDEEDISGQVRQILGLN